MKEDERGLGISRGGEIMVGSARILFDLLEGKENWGGGKVKVCSFSIDADFWNWAMSWRVIQIQGLGNMWTVFACGLEVGVGEDVGMEVGYLYQSRPQTRTKAFRIALRHQ